MKNKSAYFGSVFLLFVIGCFSGCSTSDAVPDFTSAIQLNIGNYWVYQYQWIVVPSGELVAETTDSIYIARDSVVNGRKYFVLENRDGVFQLQARDGDKILTITPTQDLPMERVIFSAHNFTDTIYQEPLNYKFGLMDSTPEHTTVPAGTFSTVKFLMFNDYAPEPGTTTDNPSYYSEDYCYNAKTWYARGIGVVRYEFFIYDNFSAYEKKLLRYRVRP